jgi:hypothetical protein
MIRKFGNRARIGIAGAALFSNMFCAHAAAPVSIPAAPHAQPWQDVSLDDYRKHLESLSALVQQCAKGRSKTSCDLVRVGTDDRVQLGPGPNQVKRLIRYGWLRELLLRAQDPDSAKQAQGATQLPMQPKDNALPAPETTSQLLADAQQRLAYDLAQTAAPPAASPAYPSANKIMRQVLAEREFHKLHSSSLLDRAREKLLEWINDLFSGISRLTAGASWLGRALVWSFLLAVALGIAWFLLRMERRWRVRLIPDADGPAPGAASARDWQLWLDDARKAAEQGQWREAIHFLYWAAISRLESKRLWPADRARTPREYLALVTPNDPRQPNLAALTGSFERTWYGGRPASESDYRRADELAHALIEGGAAQGGAA